jgi:FkbM family methyltransferase
MRRIIDSVLNRYGYRLQSNYVVDVFDEMIRKYQRPGFTFVQVGANDGKRFDPINHYVAEFQWRGLLVEPIREYFEELQRTYAGVPHVTCCNYAIYEEEKPVTLYRADPNANLPDWTKGIASLDERHHARSKTPSESMIAEVAQGIPLSTLLARHGIDKLDLLVVDTEGYDYHIVKMIDFANMPPQILRFEHGRRDEVMTKEQLSELVELLLRNDYEVHLEPYDCVAARVYWS